MLPPPAAAAWQSWRYLAMWFFLTLWFMAKGTFKNVPDYDGDLAAGIRTSATQCRSRRSGGPRGDGADRRGLRVARRARRRSGSSDLGSSSRSRGSFP